MTHVLILGASTRAAAHSAVRAGLRPICADRFADEDLRVVAEVLEGSRVLDDLPALTREVPLCPWMYTGALENSPELIAAVSAMRPLWGNPPDVVTAVRDPFQVHAALAGAGLPALAVRPESEPPPPDVRWMLKPRRSAAGRGITPFTPKAGRSRTLNEPHYFQQRAPGMPMSGLFLASADRAWLIGIARQWVGEAWLGAPPFRYCGSVGPITLQDDPQLTVQRLGEVLVERFRLRGLFGVDFLHDGRDIYLTEVNPRYTASVEVLEHAFGVPLLDWHRRAFVPSETETRRERAPAVHSAPSDLYWSQIVGKAILYAERTVTFPRLAELSPEVPVPEWPCVADRPAAGTRIGKGRPICTVLQAGTSEEDCRANLLAHVHALRQRLYGYG